MEMKVLILFLVCVFLSFSIYAMGKKKGGISPVFPAENASIELLTTEQNAFFADPMRATPHKGNPTPRKIDLSRPAPVVFRWKSQQPFHGFLQISKNRNFKNNFRQYAVRGYSAKVYNLEPGTRYYWRLKADKSSGVFSFTTSDRLPRMIHMPDVTNVRDCGGWKTVDGKTYRLGMLYRGAHLVSPQPGNLPLINSKGIEIFLKELGIRTELDLRRGGLPGKFVKNINYVNVPASAYATWREKGIFSDEQKNVYKKIFTLLADEKAYPIYFHCAGGGDRTGTMAYVLGSVLGMSEENLLDDYEYSNLSVSGERTRFSFTWTEFMKKLDTFPGKNRRDRVVNYLYSCGVTPEQLQKIRSILLID